MKKELDIRLITDNKRRFLPLLLLADEQESLIDTYLDRGELYALYDPDLRAVCVVTKEREGEWEIQNLAVDSAWQRRGYGQALVRHVVDSCRGRGHTLWVGTGDSPVTLPFYQRCGFQVDHRIKDYMLKAYDHPIFENGVQLFDKVYLRMKL